ncbi:MFS transporter [Actinospica durhamensis]|uniref:MFS transporter n=1 Tax=Actinospica durhamensis TaxID=1508375 RepID=A0A941IN20_9ACTN|nr:MFS transporter [Actinospica durhamensis]MBR7834885.1 MFS transporter [Actinospica durhamensis]
MSTGRGGLLRERNFRLFWTGESISQVGNAITVVVLPLVAIDTLHTSTFVVTLLTAMIWLPWVVIGVPAGAWIDRLPPRRVMMAADAVSAVAYASVPVAHWWGVLTLAQLIVVALVAGTASVFFNTAYQLLLPGVVDEPDLTEGNAKLMGSRQVAQIGGPGLGGLLAQAAGAVAGLLANAASFAVSFFCLAAMEPPRDRRSGSRDGGGMLDGLRFAWTDPYTRAMTTFALLVNLALTGVDALLVVFLLRTVGLSSTVAGLMLAGLGVGGVLGALVARPLGRRLGTARALLVAVPVGLGPTLLLPLAGKGPGLAFAGVALICAGCVSTIANVIVNSFIQGYIPPDILGRFISGTSAVGFAMMPAGALLAGGLATALGTRGALWILTALVAASGLTFLLTPMRHQRDLPRRPAEQSVPVLS